MVSDNRPLGLFRLCPDLGDGDGKQVPLMQHHITSDTCELRQDRGYHKCCRCIHQDLQRSFAMAERTLNQRVLASE